MPTEPRRGLVVSEVRSPEMTIRPDSHVWIMDSTDDTARIEFKGKSIDVRADSVVSVPVPRPGIDELRRRDPCFGLSPEHFEVVRQDSDHWFRLLRCRSHQRYFLEDARGGIATYTRLILVEDDAAPDPGTVWRKYHAMSDDWLNHLGIAL